jgi:protease-4
MLFMPEQRTLLEYSIMLDRAAEDDGISGVLVRLSPLGVGWASTTELRNALERFKESGKPVFVHLEVATDRELYLASVADQVMCVPETFMMVGLAAQPMYLKNLLDKVYIEPEFARVGKYKSAAETLTRSSMSEEFEESLNALLDTIHTEYTSAIAGARGLDATAVQTALDRGLLRAENALDDGLIDELAYDDELPGRFEDALGEEPEFVTANSYWRRTQQGYASGRAKKIALIYGKGPIYTGREEGGFMGVEGIWSRTFSNYVREAREDDSIDAILLRVDSPGGSGTASDIIWREIELARLTGKPVVVSMGDVAASGGYYISMPADRILALPNTITGSIGVIAGKMNMSGLFDWAGITIETVKRGEHADMFSSSRGFTPEERQILQDDLESFYRTFVTKAAEGRGMDYESLHEVAQGRVWSGRDAAERGLVDELGGLWEAIEATKGMIGAGPDEEVALVVYPRRLGFFEALRGEQANAFESSVPESLLKVARYRAVVERLSRERVLALLPVWFDWDS